MNSFHVKDRGWVLMQGIIIAILCIILVSKLSFRQPKELIFIVLGFIWLLNYVSVYFYSLRFDENVFIETQLFRPTRRLFINQVESVRPQAYKGLKWKNHFYATASEVAPLLESKIFKKFPRYPIEKGFVEKLKSVNLPIKIDPNY